MKNYIITVENIYKKDYRIPAVGMVQAIKDATTQAVASLKNHPGEELPVTNFYIRDESETQGKEHLFGTIIVDKSGLYGCTLHDENEGCACGEMCAACDEDDCDNCPFGNAESVDEPDDFDDEDCQCPMEEVTAYLSIICDQLESLTSLLEKVCKVSPEK